MPSSSFGLPLLAVAMLGASAAYGADEGTTAYGDSAEFWETHALVVAVIKDPKRMDVVVQSCTPPRHAPGTAIAFFRVAPPRGILTTTLDQPIFVNMLLKKGDRILCLVREVVPGHVNLEHAVPLKKGDSVVQFLGAGKHKSYAMLPEELPTDATGERIIADTVRLCDALATGTPPSKVKKFEAILAGRPSDQVRGVIKKALSTAVAEWEAALAKAKQLSLKD
jgi:hypothetical protein